MVSYFEMNLFYNAFCNFCLLIIIYVQAYGHELLEAHECCLKYRETGEDAELTKVHEDCHFDNLCIVFN